MARPCIRRRLDSFQAVSWTPHRPLFNDYLAFIAPHEVLSVRCTPGNGRHDHHCKSNVSISRVIQYNLRSPRFTFECRREIGSRALLMPNEYRPPVIGMFHAGIASLVLRLAMCLQSSTRIGTDLDNELRKISLRASTFEE